MSITIPMTFAGLFAALEKPEYVAALASARLRIRESVSRYEDADVLIWLSPNDYFSLTADLWYEAECGDHLIKSLEVMKNKTPGDKQLMKLLKGWRTQAADTRQKFRERQFQTAGEKFIAMTEITPVGAKEFREAYLKIGGKLEQLPDCKGEYGDIISRLWDVLWSRKDHANEMTFAIYLA